MTGEALLYWGVLLILLSLLLIVAEAFVPSGGVIAAISAVLSIAGIVMLFRYDTVWGVTGLLTVVVLGPIAFFWSLNALPNTPFGRKLIGAESDEAAAERELEDSQARARLAALVGRTGVALTDLHPIGEIELDPSDEAPDAEPDRRDALADHGWIDRGSRVEIVGHDLHEVRVREI